MKPVIPDSALKEAVAFLGRTGRGEIRASDNLFG